MQNSNSLKQQAAEAAVQHITTNMKIGLGTGSTVAYAIHFLAKKVKEEALNLSFYSTSFSTRLLCSKLGLQVEDLGTTDSLDFAVDGADEIDPNRNCIKGRGAAHTLEKLVASMAKEFVVVADDSKKVPSLGQSFPVPIEVLADAYSYIIGQTLAMGATKADVRMCTGGKDGPVISDSGHFIIDAYFKSIQNPVELQNKLDSLSGVVEHGLFCNIVNKVILATPKGLEVF